jgi:putative ABC transport system ATP-binding protein
MLKLEHVGKHYQTGRLNTVSLTDINLQIRAQEFVAIMGPSGCGKSTLLNILGMLDTTSNGQYFFNDEDITALPESKLKEIRRNNVGFVFQFFNLLEQYTVAENIALALEYQGINAKEKALRVEEAMDSVGIAHKAHYFPEQLSGGQQQRVAIARAIVTKPKIILADEPTGNLDSNQGKEIMGMLKAQHDAGATLIIVTHSKQLADAADRVLYLLDGKLQLQATYSAE